MPEKKTEKTVDELLKDAEERIKALESGKLSLEDAFSAYKEGIDLLKQSTAKIDRVEKQVMQMMEDGKLKPFDGENGEDEDDG